MKYFEILLKLAFLGGALYGFIVKDISYVCIVAFLALSLVLGLVLIFNKKQSYGYELSKREIVIRRIEGIILIAFSIVVFCVQG